jgi:hypothetical protein
LNVHRDASCAHLLVRGCGCTSELSWSRVK